MANNIKIAWEHFNTNYTNKDDEINDDILDEDIDFDDEEEMNSGPIKGLFPFKLPNFAPQVHYTPWGAFNADNPLSPTNMYDIYMGHFRGFTVHTIPNFVDIMNSVEGLAIWTQQDPYCIAIGPAKSYSSEEVKLNIENALFAALGITKNNIIPSLIHESKELSKNGISNIYVHFPNGQSKVYQAPSEDELSDILKLKSQIQGIILIKDGELI